MDNGRLLNSFHNDPAFSRVTVDVSSYLSLLIFGIFVKIMMKVNLSGKPFRDLWSHSFPQLALGN